MPLWKLKFPHKGGIYHSVEASTLRAAKKKFTEGSRYTPSQVKVSGQRRTDKASVRSRYRYYMNKGYGAEASRILSIEPKWVGKEFRDVLNLYQKKQGKVKGRKHALSFLRGKFGRR